MSMHVALLRGINVGGRNLVAMSELRDLLGSLGLSGVRSLLQSGNLVFHGGRRSGTALERLLEAETKKRLGVTADYLVRSSSEWQAIIERNPFRTQAERDPSHLVVMFLKSAPTSNGVKALEAAVKGPETIRADGRQLYIVYPIGIGRSKLTGVVIERTLGTRGTGRNWNTVLKLAAMIQE
jgi:uncharacterized protein (DUF1697 family)